MPSEPEVWPVRRRRGAGLLAVLCGVGGAVYVASHREAFAELELAPVWLVPLALAELTLLVLRGALLRRLCRALDLRLVWREAVGLQAGSLLANYLVPGLGGTSLRAGYLKRRHDLPLAAFGSLLAATYVLQYLVLCAVGLAVSLAAPGWPRALRWILAAGLAGGIAVLALRPLAATRAERAGALGRFVASAFAGWRRMRAAGLGTPVLLATLQLLGTAAALACACAALGRPLAPGEAVLFAVLSDGSILLNLTPSGLGIVESAVGAAAAWLGMGAPLGVGAAVLRRLVNVVVAGLGAGLAVGFPSRRK